MKVKGLIWLGTRTANFDAMAGFCRDILGMAQSYQEPGFASFDMPDGSRMEVFGPASNANMLFTNPVAGFLVDDVAAARAEMETKGIEFIGPVHAGKNGYAWSHFRAPDGFIYEIAQSPGD